MSTSSRARIDQENAQRSVALITQTVILPTENLDDYNRYVKRFADEWNPQGATELFLVQSLVDTAWRLNRVVMLETNVLALTAGPEIQVRAIATLSMHSQRLSRQFERTLAQLRELQESRKSQQTQQQPDDGFVFQTQPSALDFAHASAPAASRIIGTSVRPQKQSATAPSTA